MKSLDFLWFLLIAFIISNSLSFTVSPIFFYFLTFPLFVAIIVIVGTIILTFLEKTPKEYLEVLNFLDQIEREEEWEK